MKNLTLCMHTRIRSSGSGYSNPSLYEYFLMYLQLYSSFDWAAPDSHENGSIIGYGTFDSLHILHSSYPLNMVIWLPGWLRQIIPVSRPPIRGPCTWSFLPLLCNPLLPWLLQILCSLKSTYK